VYPHVRGRSITILKVLQELPLTFSEVEKLVGLNHDLTKLYLKNLRKYGLIEKTEYGWSLTEKGKHFIDRMSKLDKIRDRFGDKKGNISLNLSENLSHNLSPYNNNNNEVENNNIKNIGNSFVFASKTTTLQNKMLPSFLGQASPLQDGTHTFSLNNLSVKKDKNTKKLLQVMDALSSKYGIGATISAKLVKDAIISTLLVSDDRAIKNKIKALISVGFLIPVDSGLFRIGGKHETEKVV
jgi:predicted transcriptional regulator